ncbi:hypothetical protein [Acaryochloris marina]|uniref:hypothetical protein n=1 Tax=Acaryochloris marina TaxID=155978 RepID=UPI001EE650FA|nr:hypothetical protein [Acaryochloris marina]BDM77905.1 hypothetical protein AM10699_07750 [Acaryochloris marina MBIC10699]
MVFTQFHQPISSPRWNVPVRSRKSRVHRYEHSALSSDFCIEAAPDQSGFFMTSCKAGVRRGDVIHISEAGQRSEYRIDEIDYYSDPSDMWIAKLRTVS